MGIADGRVILVNRTRRNFGANKWYRAKILTRHRLNKSQRPLCKTRLLSDELLWAEMEAALTSFKLLSKTLELRKPRRIE
jgi:hypothetical protein